MTRLQWKQAADRLLSASLAFVIGAGTAAAQAPSYGSSPYLGQGTAPSSETTAHPVQGVVYFDEPLPTPKTGPAPVQATAAPPAAVAAPPLVPVPADEAEASCPCCNSGATGGHIGRCATCGKDAIVPPPLGSYAHSIFTAQAALARANFFVIDPWDWKADSDVLNRGGELHLDALIRKMAYYRFPVQVAPGPDAALNVARQARIVALLNEHNLSDAATQVVIGSSTAEGLRSDEIEIIGSRILMGDGATRSYGAPGGVLNGEIAH